jgi:hypothetical protein
MKVQGIAFIARVLRYDADAEVVVLQRRDSETGKVSMQLPSERAVRELVSQRPQPVSGAEKAEPVAAKRVAEPPLRPPTEETAAEQRQGVSLEA